MRIYQGHQKCPRVAILLMENDVHTNEGVLASQNTKRRILVVDDQSDITITLKIALEERTEDLMLTHSLIQNWHYLVLNLAYITW